jgi:two-component system, NarL family, response regulator NreC
MRQMAEGLFYASSNVNSTLIPEQELRHPPQFSTPTQRDLKTTRVLIIGSRDLFRAAIRALLESVRQLEVVGEAQSELETIDLVERLHPHVLLMDVGMQPDLLQPLRRVVPDLRIVVLSEDNRSISNADAVVPCSAELPILLDAIKCDGMPEETPIAARKPSGPFGLTPREMDIVRTISEGRTNQEIAESLSISLSTVKHYVTRVFDKLGVFNRVELVIFAMNHNLNGIHPNDAAVVSAAGEAVA